VALPDQQRVLEAFASLDLLVCLDVRTTATTALADVVIGCKLSLEKSDTTLAHDLRFARPFAQATPAVARAPGDLLEEWEVFQGLADRMGSTWDLSGRVGMPIPIDVEDVAHDRPTSGEDIWDRLCSGGRVDLGEIRLHPHGLAPEGPAVIVEAVTPSADRFQLADESLIAELASTLSETIEAGFDLLLISRRMWEYYNSWGQDVASVRKRWGANPAFLNPQDMVDLGITEGATVTVASPRGELVAVARSDSDLPRGVVSMAHCWGSSTGGLDEDTAAVGSCTNVLVDAGSDLDQIVGMARQSAIPVRVTPRS
jgi:anaerobic selenocysteine-containing dehydrogenase